MEKDFSYFLLNNEWKMKYMGEQLDAGCVPFSMYDTLLNNKKIPDPYYGENEKKALEYARDDYTFVKKFLVDEEVYNYKRPALVFEMIDTLASVFVNGKLVGKTNNMHRSFTMELKNVLVLGENEIRIVFASPVKYAEEMINKRHIWGQDTITLPGYQYIRKAHYMFGWDWGPCLPDMGVYRDIYIYDQASSIVDDIYVGQKHLENSVGLDIDVAITEDTNAKELILIIKNEKGEGEVELRKDIIAKNIAETVSGGLEGDQNLTINKFHFQHTVENPAKWWPNGLGEQNLYTIEARILNDKNEKIASKVIKVGLRTMEVSTDKDEWGREFCFKVNGIKIFTMGADYIPENGIIPKIKDEDTYHLLRMCKDANFNCIRVWGGGYYPGDYFYELCDEMGFIVWQDHMYACATYVLDDEFRENIRIEIEQNVKRLRHHPCIGIWCGNNEMATAWECWGLPQEEDLIEFYDEMFNHIIKDATIKYDPVTKYWQSSPLSTEEGRKANDYDDGDVHYWDVWHGLKPFEDAENYYFRFCSEFGFESLPDFKTLKTVLYKEDYNLYSPSLEAHHKCTDGQHKMMYYMGQFMRMPSNFEQMIYGSQVMQAEAIRTSVEHMRRNRGRCMGAVYWQLNDSNPTVSWSSVDYFRNPKALQYFAKDFFMPTLLSAKVDGTSMEFNVSNESHKAFEGEIIWYIKDNSSEILEQGKLSVKVDAFSARWFEKMDFANLLGDEIQRRGKYLEYMLMDGKKCISRKTQLFVPFKYFHFEDPKLSAYIVEKEDCYDIVVMAGKFAKDIFVSLKESYAYFAENWFDLNAGEEKVLKLLKKDTDDGMNLERLQEEFQMMSMYDVGK